MWLTGPLGAALLFGVVVMVMSVLLLQQLRVRTANRVLRARLAGGDGSDGGPPANSSVSPSSAVTAGAQVAAVHPVGGTLARDEGAPDLSPSVAAETAPGLDVTTAPLPFIVAPGVARVEVLGPGRVSVAGKEVAFGRAEGRELFALLATSKEGELSDRLVDRLWPGDGERGARRLESGIRDINAAMRAATGLAAEVKFVVKAGPRRRLAKAYFEVDWWRFEAAYVRANTAAQEQSQIEALRQMVSLYRGPLLADRDDLWCVPVRQAALTQAVNAAERLAELQRGEDPDRALAVLQLAVDRIDRHSESLWCQIMTIQGELGRTSAVHRTFQQFAERLAELDALPSPQARQTYHRFVGSGSR